MIDDLSTAPLVAARVHDWLDRLVIGERLCPFARRVRDAGLIRFLLSDADSESALEHDLRSALDELLASDPAIVDTALLIAPRFAPDFDDFAPFLKRAELLLDIADARGAVQFASFHPAYRFAQAGDDDPANFSNRAPYPIVHLLREASVAAAVSTHPDPEGIYRANVERLRALGLASVRELWRSRSESR
jgi:uncharacterized protein